MPILPLGAMKQNPVDAIGSSPQSVPTGRPATCSREPAESRIALALALAMAAICVYAMRRADPDLWGYLSYGRFFVQQGGPVASDPFSYTCASCTWNYFEYLSHISLWLAYAVGGPLGLIALKCVLGGIAVGFVLKTVRSIDPRPTLWLPVYLLMLGIAPRFFLFRPQLYTFAFFAFFVEVLIGHLAGRRTRLWLLVPATTMWANLHGGFLAGLGVIGLALMLRIGQHVNGGTSILGAVRAAGVLWMTLFAAIGASLINPQGWRLWRYLLTELSHDTNRRYIDEWMPLSFSRDPWSAYSALFLLIALLTTGIAAGQRRVRLLELHPWQWLAASTPLALMTVLSVRHLPVLAVWISPVLVLLAGALPSTPKSWPRRFSTTLFGATAVPAFLTLTVVATNPAASIGIPEGTLGGAEPFGAVEFIKENGLDGNLYLPLWWGSYATWELYPRVRVSMDGRNVSLYPTDMVRKNLEFYVLGDADTDEPLRFASDYLMVPTGAPVLARLGIGGRWRKIYEDPDCVLFLRFDELIGRVPPHLVQDPVVRTAARRPRFFR